jgi:hypothetical protein
VIAPKPQNEKPSIAHELIAGRVIRLLLRMLPAVDFNDDTRMQ